ncbi:MAG: hypothetical protein IKQ35_02020 [Bacilli bacterium]|nr:hypothetical protein [Bacilli bacterium]
MWNEVLENLVVVKRSGQRVNFNASKIAIAIKKAFDAVYDDVDEKQVYRVFESVLKYINDNYKDRKTINVEDVQDIIENNLKDLGFEKVYCTFSEYRQKRAASRKVFSEKQQHKFVKVVESVENIDSTLTPKKLLHKFGKIISSEYAKSYILDSKYVRALEEGNIFIHNLEFFPLGYISHLNLKLDINPEDDFLDEFLSDIINSQNEISSEIGINNLDLLLEQYFLNYYKKMLRVKIKCYLEINGMLELIAFNRIEDAINQISDINVNIDYFDQFAVNPILKNAFGIILDDVVEYTKDYINITINRIFTILRSYQTNNTYTISMSNSSSKVTTMARENIIMYLADNNSFENIHVVFKIIPNMDEVYLSKIASLIINQKNISLSFPNSSFNKDDFNEVEYFSNGLRIFETINEVEKRSTGRMIVTNTSINMARLGLKYLNNNNISNFYEELDQLLDLAKNEMLLAFETIGNKNKENYQALFTGNILGDERLESGQKIRKIIKSGVLNVGLVGLKECVLSFEQDPNKQFDLLIKILEYVSKKMKQFSDETKLYFSIFEPSGLASRKYFIAIDKSIYGTHKEITDKNAYDLIDSAKFIEDRKNLAKVQKLLNGGNLVTINISNKTNNKKIVDLIKELMNDDFGFVKMKVDK